MIYKAHICLAGKPLLAALCAVTILGACGSSKASVETSVVFTRLPGAGEGSSETVNPIEGRVTGERPGQRVVVFAHSGVWWIQPLADRYLTEIKADSTWKTTTHPGSQYAALVVDSSWRPPPTLDALPRKGGPVAAVAVAEGTAPAWPQIPTLQFSGYQWRLRQTASNTGGSVDYYDPANAWIDRNGFLHLRIVGGPDKWSGSEATLTRSLGYGSYRFVVQDVSHLDPADILAFSTWDDSGPTREMDIEIGRWGEPASKNAQFVIQPFHVPANSVRFMAAQGTSTFSLQWEPGKATFRNRRGAREEGIPVSEHVFTSGVPLPGEEMVRINFYVYQSRRHSLKHGTEVVIEKFEFLP